MLTAYKSTGSLRISVFSSAQIVASPLSSYSLAKYFSLYSYIINKQYATPLVNPFTPISPFLNFLMSLSYSDLI